VSNPPSLRSAIIVIVLSMAPSAAYAQVKQSPSREGNPFWGAIRDPNSRVIDPGEQVAGVAQLSPRQEKIDDKLKRHYHELMSKVLKQRAKE